MKDQLKPRKLTTPKKKKAEDTPKKLSEREFNLICSNLILRDLMGFKELEVVFLIHKKSVHRVFVDVDVLVAYYLEAPKKNLLIVNDLSNAIITLLAENLPSLNTISIKDEKGKVVSYKEGSWGELIKELTRRLAEANTTKP